LIPGSLAFILYLVTCSPTINFTDSGELITVAWTGGIAHPPGYPLYTLVGSLFIHIPLGDPAWRMNVLSALFAAVAVSLFYGLVTDTLMGMAAFRGTSASRSGHPRASATSATPAAKSAPSGKTARAKSISPLAKERAGERRAPGDKNRATPASSTKPIKERSLQSAASTSVSTEDEHLVTWAAVAGGMAAAGLLAVSVTFWNWATQAKFYTLHFAFVAALPWLALRARRALITDAANGSTLAPIWPPKAWPSSTRLLHLLVFTIGLSLTNHFLTFLLLPGIAVLLLTPLRYALWRRVVRHAGTLVIAGLLPLLVYLYLPIRAGMHPLIAWGTPDNWSDFWRHVTAQSYQGFFGASDLGNHLVDAIVYAANQFGPWLGTILLVPIGVGVTYLWRTDRGLLVATALVALTDLLVVLNYNIREIVTYYVPFYMVVLWWAGLGVTQGIVWVHRQLPTTSSTPTLVVSRSSAITLVLGAMLPLIGLASNWGAAGHRDNYTAELFVRNAFKNFRQDAIVLTNYWDLTSAAFYLQHVRNERRDVVIIDKGALRHPFYLDYLERNYSDLISKNAGPFAEYKALLREFLNTGRTPARLSNSYLNVLNGFIDTNLGQRPVYTSFIVAANDQPELQEVRALLGNRQNQLVPEGFGYRIATGPNDLGAQDPRFDLRGITSQKVPLDEIDASVIALYPPTLQNIGMYMQNSSTPADKEVGARLLTQAQEMQYLAPLQDARPRLR
jgi:hypothetical protein